MIRVGWSITRINPWIDGSPAAGVTSGYCDFEREEDATAFGNALGLAHDQDRYDVRVWQTPFALSMHDVVVTMMKPPFPPASSP